MNNETAAKIAIMALKREILQDFTPNYKGVRTFIQEHDLPTMALALGESIESLIEQASDGALKGIFIDTQAFAYGLANAFNNLDETTQAQFVEDTIAGMELVTEDKQAYKDKFTSLGETE